MKHYVVTILLVATSVVVVVETHRNRSPQVSAPGWEFKRVAGQIDEEAARSETDRDPGPASKDVTKLIPAESHETAGAYTAQPNTSAKEAHPYEALLARAKQDLSPRVVSLITNQLARLGREDEERYDVEDWHRLERAKMVYVGAWAVALVRFAENNAGMCPATLDQAAEFYPQDCAWLLSVFDKDRFEIVYHGSLNDLRDPASVIVVRERVATVVSGLLQHWQKAYIYGNGQSGTVAGFRSTDEFQEYEGEHLANSDGG